MKNRDNCIKLGITDKDTYKNLENAYKNIFEIFLSSRINLKKYDNILLNSDLGFGPPSSKVRIKSELGEFLSLKYFYILNEFYIEKLSESELDILRYGSLEDKFSLVSKTYKDIILANYVNGKYENMRFKVNYTYYPSQRYYSYNDELVIAIYYGKNTKDYNTKENYLENYKSKKVLLENIVNDLTNEFKEQMDLNIKIIYEKVS